jgi:hypothetical protein
MVHFTKHKICSIEYDGNYIHDFSDYPMDVDGDGSPELILNNGILHMKNSDPYCGLWDFSEEYKMHWGTVGAPVPVDPALAINSRFGKLGSAAVEK